MQVSVAAQANAHRAVCTRALSSGPSRPSLPHRPSLGACGLRPRPARLGRFQTQQHNASTAADMPFEGSMPEEAAPEVFPRLKERDPYRVLGVSAAADFEEIQDARNYLYDTYKHHERSREAIEAAFETLLKKSMRSRHRLGFQPPRSGRKGEAMGEALPESFGDRVKAVLEPSVPGTTIVNEGTIYAGLALFAAFQVKTGGSDPTLPILGSLCYSVYKIFDKRKKSGGDGPFWPFMVATPIWGAVISGIASLVLGTVFGALITNYVPLPPQLKLESVGIFFTVLAPGIAAIFFK